MASNAIKKRTPLWKYFDEKESNPEIAICLVCAKEIRRKNANTKGMREHLKWEHAAEWKDFEELVEEKKNALAEIDEKKKSTVVLNQKPGPIPITAFFDGKRSEKYDATSVRQKLLLLKLQNSLSVIFRHILLLMVNIFEK